MCLVGVRPDESSHGWAWHDVAGHGSNGPFWRGLVRSGSAGVGRARPDLGSNGSARFVSTRRVRAVNVIAGTSRGSRGGGC
jgi:hypothetical protein